MHISNPLRMNDWPITKFMAVVLAVQLALWGVIGCEALGLQIPVMRQIVGFVYLSFVPGVVVLRILKMHNLGSIETLVYSVGLSLATVMFTGVVVNGVYPSFGISAPISTIPLMISFTVLISALCAIAYKRDRDFSAPTYVDTGGLLSPPVLLLFLLPLISILGTQLVNFYQNNVILMALIVAIVLVVLLIGFNKFIPQNLYPFAIFTIGLSLVFYRSLISQYISGFDIHEEYYVANLVKSAGTWNLSTPIMVNGMLSITMLAPIISNISSLDITWVFKVIYPLLFSLVPLGLYQVFRKQTDERLAFFSVFFFVAVYEFYTEIPVLLRQQIATLFLVLLVLLMINKGMSGTKRMFLFIIFGASLAVSHYGLSYVYIFYLFSAWLILVLLDNPNIRRIKDRLYARLDSRNINKPAGNSASLNTGGVTITSTFVELFVVFALMWYMSTSGSKVFDAYVNVGGNIVKNFTEAFLVPQASQGLTMLLNQPQPGLLRWVNFIMNYLNQIFIVIGIFVLLIKYWKLKFEREYAAFSALSLVILFAGLLVPFLTLTANMERLYHIALIFLAPFFVIGAMTVFRMIGRLVKILWKNKSARKSLLEVSALSVLSVYVAVFFLYQTGFVWQMAEGHSGSISLSQKWVKENGSIEEKARFYSTVTPEPDILSARWLSEHMNPEEKVYATFSDAQVHAFTSYGMLPAESVIAMTRRTQTIPKEAYIYLQYSNVVEGIATEFNYDPRIPFRSRHSAYSMAEISHLFGGKNLIYTNGGSEIYR